ncbi:SUMO-activating enzyme [Babesia ovis]|uniref:SUMO-activating enzyme n=1 Tax=Babesia ovis TaxID=5869 RepID=A0A9W5T8H0_BABOV|nr:SUMO-activating enzyme [Babesia ovis]
MTSNKEAAIDVDSNTSISDSHTPLSDCQIDVNVIDIPTRNTFDSEPSRASTANNETTLSNQDAMLYDRQIRLWGIEAQQKLMNSRVLFLGKNGIQEEAIKNLILAGMSITLANDLNVTEEDVQHSFFLRGSDAGKNHAEALVHRMHEMVSDKRKVTSINSAIIKDLNKDDMQKFHTDDFPLTDYDVVSCAMETYLLPKVVSLCV